MEISDISTNSSSKIFFTTLGGRNAAAIGQQRVGGWMFDFGWSCT
jgi:hypothetical protein